MTTAVATAKKKDVFAQTRENNSWKKKELWEGLSSIGREGVGENRTGVGKSGGLVF